MEGGTCQRDVFGGIKRDNGLGILDRKEGLRKGRDAASIHPF